MSKYAVITGASSGIGLQFAKILDKQGYSLILVARRKERLDQLAKHLHAKCEVIQADLSKEQECYDLYEQLKKKKIEVFINNAGFGECGKFIETDLSKELDMIQVNIKAVHILTKLIVQKMQKQGYGYVLNVASSAGLMPAGPYMATYYATKSYVASFTQAIARELKEMRSNVYVGCLCPGPVDTEFNQVANVKFALKGIEAKECAAYAIAQMYRRKVIIVPSLKMKTAIWGSKFLPKSMTVAIAAHLQRSKINQS